MKRSKVKIGTGWFASGVGRGKQNKPVYLIDGYAYGYHPKYARQAYTPLDGDLANYVPLNNGMDTFFQVEPSDHKVN